MVFTYRFSNFSVDFIICVYGKVTESEVINFWIRVSSKVMATQGIPVDMELKKVIRAFFSGVFVQWHSSVSLKHHGTDGHNRWDRSDGT